MKKLLVLTLVMASFMTATLGVSAAEKPQEKVYSLQETSNGLNEKQTSDLAQYNRVFVENGMYNEFRLTEDSKLLSDKGFTQLQNEYNLNDTDMDFIKHFIETNNRATETSVNMKGRLSIKNFRVYMTYSEAKSYLGTVITSGPIAVTGALAVLGATVGGPAGAVICGVAGLYGASYIVDVTKQAMRQGRGVWIGWGGIGIN